MTLEELRNSGGLAGLTDLEFVDWCYHKILGRHPGSEQRRGHAEALRNGHATRDDLLVQLLSCEEYVSRTTGRQLFPPGHFYSPIPSIEDREHFLRSGPPDDTARGICLNERRQLDLFRAFMDYYGECPFPEEKTERFRYYFENPLYSYGDALTLYSMIRHFKPQKIIEVGSGFSSCVMLDTNRDFFDDDIDITFIEPYPELLYSVAGNIEGRQMVVAAPVQCVDLDLFRTLGRNDILFIDSTHVSKLNSDVNKVFFDILPVLRSGVVIHFHDVFWPFEYPRDWIEEGRAWNEVYMLRSFLQFNHHFEIIFFLSYLMARHRNRFEDDMPLYLRNPGGNFWMQKR